MGGVTREQGPSLEGYLVFQSEEGVQMKRFPVLIGILVLTLIGGVGAGLQVNEFRAGEKVVLDDAGNYWIWDMSQFGNLTYDQQITGIGSLGGTYGGVTGNWHMATEAEMTGLWSYSGSDIASSFGPTYIDHSWGDPEYYWSGRYDKVGPAIPPDPAWGEPGDTTHYLGEVHQIGLSLIKDSLNTSTVGDNSRYSTIGAWVTTGPGATTVVPAPGAVILGVSGLLSMAAGIRRRRRNA